MENNEEIKNLIKKEEELANYDGDDKVVSSEEFKEEMARGATAPVFKVSSGMKKLDSVVDGFWGGELVTISGPTKQGKTTFAHTLTKNFEEQGIGSLWFSYEVTASQLFEKFAKAKVFYLPKRLKQKNLDWIEDRIMEGKLKYNTRAVFIDHLHYVADMAKQNTSIEIGTVVRRLKSIAVDLNVPIFLMAHLKMTKYDKMPTESDLRDSSFITQESDKTFLVWRERRKKRGSQEYEFSGKTLLIVSNDRRTGAMGKIIPLEFKDGELTEWVDAFDQAVAQATGDSNYDPALGF